ncbi:hypothetical protein CEP88_00595 [Roseobacter denitrificans]|uniref:Uncharacterized protein n=1 Tax=Roseobacter denitrificans (strain ATCC 33942 / OCh 114) TaxID=375451 RepID=Q168A1_ROSDO|nr:hypothetical protein [Roseobacter denitrificans]ABG31692.1 hypothetical protein RD1_2091 [Roseobacter denitrificans OCh 114]AVL51287.1 hypothetical protein CEP88_00595 [Roseobacter denitrificans]SFF88261.1 hypothetical protein SAMN05443635_103140 [Roseobacter denitrificans OCh 114]
MMDASEIEALFTRSGGQFAFARWGRPIAPVVFGVTDETLSVIKGALEAVMALSGHKMAETDPELGSNLMMFFFREWDELPEVPGLDRLVPDLGPLLARLKQADANQYRIFHFDTDGGIKACFVFLRMEENLSAVPAETLALSQIVQSVLLWSDTAFKDRSPLAVAGEKTILRPDIAGLIRAAYDPVLPVASSDASHALRLAARVGLSQ